MRGCCYGLPGHPAQLYSSAALFVLGILLWNAGKSRPVTGKVTAMYGIGYAFLRFNVEFFRGDQEIFALGLTHPQWMSLGLFVISMMLVLRFRLFHHDK
jgi:phosphatidylglycerol:prolipoprotein diacylglycerol transferase